MVSIEYKVWVSKVLGSLASDGRFLGSFRKVWGYLGVWESVGPLFNAKLHCKPKNKLKFSFLHLEYPRHFFQTLIFNFPQDN